MLKALLALLRRIFQGGGLLEVAGAGLIVWGCYVQWGTAVALIVAGVCLVLKAAEPQLTSNNQ